MSAPAGSADDGARKRARVAATAVRAGVTRVALTKILEALADTDDEVTTDRKQIGRAFAQFNKVQTPYGVIVKELQVKLDNGADLTIPYICPAAFLHFACATSSLFAEMLVNALNGRIGNIALYFDDIRPGNVLRPDQGRLTTCAYWTVLEFPEHVRAHAAGWMTLFASRAALIGQWPGQLSGFTAELLRRIFGPLCNLLNPGIRVPLHAAEVSVRLQLRGVVSDEKALKEVLAVKGASGSKPCIRCKNLLTLRGAASDAPPARDGYVQNLAAAAHLEQLDQHTNASVFAMVDELIRQRPLLRKLQFHRLEQVMGISCDDRTLLFQADLRSLVRPADGARL